MSWSLSVLVHTRGNSVPCSQQGSADKNQGSRLMAAGGESPNSRNQWHCPVHKASESVAPKEQLLITTVKVVRKLHWLLFIRFLIFFFPAGCACMHFHTHINLSSHISCLSSGNESILKSWPQLWVMWLIHAGQKLCCTQTSLQKKWMS